MAPDSVRPPVRHLKRLLWLVVCVVAGLAIGAAGAFLSGSALWYLALPCAVAAGWLLVADPAQCAPRRGRESGTPTDHESAGGQAPRRPSGN